MNLKSTIVLLVFLLWSGGSWWFYTCKIKEKCAGETQEIASKTPDTISQEESLAYTTPIEKDTIGKRHAADLEQSVVKKDSVTILYFQTKQTHFDENELINNYLSSLANQSSTWTDTIIHIIGHTDDVGGSELNLSLSKKRAEDVKKHLIEKGVSSEIITTEGKGELSPLINDTTNYARNQNRRVEIIFKNKN